jgi:putative lipoprotein
MIALSCGCAATPQDPWWGSDKAAHLAVSSAISAAATQAAIDAGEPEARAHAQAVGVVLVVGAGKEAYDEAPGGTGWSWRDMVWNLLGGLLGGALVRAAE